MSETARERLRRLLRAPPPAPADMPPADVPAAPAGVPASIGETSDADVPPADGVQEAIDGVRARLARRDARRSAEPRAPEARALETGALAARAPVTGVLAARAPGASLPAPCSGLPPGLAREGSDLFARRVDAHPAHGAWALAEIDAAEADVLALLTGDAALGALDLARAVYLDTETSGLAGGAGTWVFLVGLGRFSADGRDGARRFEVWQGFLADPREERALLAEAAERIRDAPAVVSFFGKSFDRHRLEDKMRQHGIPPPFADRPHLDLYHPLRRLYRGAFADARLATLERELCGVERADDLSGAFAPAAWFDFQAGRPHRLAGVFEHNLHDVRSLVTLAAHLGRVRHDQRADGRALAGPAAPRAEGLARALCAAGRWDEALAWVERARSLADTRALRLLRADALRRAGRTAEALGAWRELAREPADASTARVWIELARLCERALGDRAAARAACAEAVAALAHVGTSERARLARELASRSARLARAEARACERAPPPGARALAARRRREPGRGGAASA